MTRAFIHLIRHGTRSSILLVLSRCSAHNADNTEEGGSKFRNSTGNSSCRFEKLTGS